MRPVTGHHGPQHLPKGGLLQGLQGFSARLPFLTLPSPTSLSDQAQLTLEPPKVRGGGVWADTCLGLRNYLAAVGPQAAAGGGVAPPLSLGVGGRGLQTPHGHVPRGDSVCAPRGWGWAGCWGRKEERDSVPALVTVLSHRYERESGCGLNAGPYSWVSRQCNLFPSLPQFNFLFQATIPVDVREFYSFLFYI